MKNLVYGLVDPRNDLVYYVGKTSVGKKRPLEHLLRSHSEEVNNWVKRLQENWIVVKVIVLEEVEELDTLPTVEESWIRKWSFLNPELFNKQLMQCIDYDVYSEEDEEEYNNLRGLICKIGTILKRRRIAVGVTQETLAEKCNISRYTISKVENNGFVNVDTIKKISLGLEGIRINKASRLRKRVCENHEK